MNLQNMKDVRYLPPVNDTAVGDADDGPNHDDDNYH